jgi:hypothetical protein
VNNPLENLKDKDNIYAKYIEILWLWLKFLKQLY